jgi:hypothetical protein
MPFAPLVVSRLTMFFKLSPPNFSSWDWKATAKFSHDLKSNIQVSCNGPDWKLLLRGRGQKKSNKILGMRETFVTPDHRPPLECGAVPGAVAA